MPDPSASPPEGTARVSTEVAAPAPSATPAASPPAGQAPPPPPPVETARPTWLYQQQQPTPEPPQPQYTVPPQQYPQYVPPPQQPVPQGPSPLDLLLERPSEFVDQRMLPIVGPLAGEMIQLRQQFQQMRQERAQMAVAQARSAIEGHYESVFNRDSAFGNPQVRATAEQAMAEHHRDAQRRAMQYNDYSLLEQEKHPYFAQAILFLSKLQNGYPAGQAPTPVGMGQAYTESARAPSGDQPIMVDDDTKAAWRRAGITEEQGIRAIMNRRKRGSDDLV